MSEMFNPHAPATAYDHNTTIVAVLEAERQELAIGRGGAGPIAADETKLRGAQRRGGGWGA
jgi:hypothetical protein